MSSNWKDWKNGKISDEVYKMLVWAHNTRMAKGYLPNKYPIALKWTRAKVLSGETKIDSDQGNDKVLPYDCITLINNLKRVTHNDSMSGHATLTPWWLNWGLSP